MFTFALVSLQAIDIFLFIFNLFPLFAERGRRNWEEIIHNENHWPQLLHKSGVECQIDRFACFAAYFSSFPKENAFQSLEENLWTINRKKEFPDFSLTFKDFPWLFKKFTEVSLTLKNFRFPLTFPWQWQPYRKNSSAEGHMRRQTKTTGFLGKSVSTFLRLAVDWQVASCARFSCSILRCFHILNTAPRKEPISEDKSTATSSRKHLLLKP